MVTRAVIQLDGNRVQTVVSRTRARLIINNATNHWTDGWLFAPLSERDWLLGTCITTTVYVAYQWASLKLLPCLPNQPRCAR